MKTVEKILGPVRLALANGADEQVFVTFADPLGVWTAEDAFIPWSAIDRVEVDR